MVVQKKYESAHTKKNNMPRRSRRQSSKRRKSPRRGKQEQRYRSSTSTVLKQQIMDTLTKYGVSVDPGDEVILEENGSVILNIGRLLIDIRVKNDTFVKETFGDDHDDIPLGKYRRWRGSSAPPEYGTNIRVATRLCAFYKQHPRKEGNDIPQGIATDLLCMLIDHLCDKLGEEKNIWLEPDESENDALVKKVYKPLGFANEERYGKGEGTRFLYAPLKDVKEACKRRANGKKTVPIPVLALQLEKTMDL